MSKTPNENNPQNDSVDSDAVLIVKGDIVNRLQYIKGTTGIEMINKPIEDSKVYKTIKGKCLSLSQDIINSKLSAEDKKDLLFDLEMCRAITAFRAEDFDNHSKHLTRAYKDYNPDKNQSIIELGQWNTRYKALSEEQQKKVSGIFSLHSSLLKGLTEKVTLQLKAEKYNDAFNEMVGLEHSSNMSVVNLYASIYIARNDPKQNDLSKALKHCETKIQYHGTDEKIKKALSEFYKELAQKFKTQGAEQQANEATKIAESYTTPSATSTAASAPVTKELLKSKQELEKVTEEFKKVQERLVVAEAKTEKHTQLAELEAQLKTQAAQLEAQYKAKAVALDADYKAKLEAFKAQTSPTTVKPSAPDVSALPPSYSDAEYQKKLAFQQDLALLQESKFLAIARNAGTATVITADDEDSVPTAGTGSVTTAGTATVITAGTGSVTTAETGSVTTAGTATVINAETVPVITNAAQAEIEEITTILNSDKPNMDRVVVLCKKAIDNQKDLYTLIDDPVVLCSLASGYLKLGKFIEAEKTVNKVFEDATKNGNDAYDKTKDPSALSLMAEKYEMEGFPQKSVEACKKAALQPGYTPCVKNYQLLKEIGEAKKLIDKDFAIEAFKAAKYHTADNVQRAELCMTVIKMHLSSNKLENAKKEYLEFVNNVPYQTIYKLAKSPEEIQQLVAVDADLATYKSLFAKYKANPSEQAATTFYYDTVSIIKPELKIARIMEVNVRTHNQIPMEEIQALINGNPHNKTISYLAECYNKWYSNTTNNAPDETYVKPIGDIDHCLHQYLFDA